MKRVVFNLQKAIPAAWDMCWARNLANRKTGHDFRGQTFYLCANDVEQQVRAFAQDTLNGKPWGTTPIWYGSTYSGVRITGNLQSEVRDWLLDNPKIMGHNFNRGHISGMRFRPVGEPLNDAEKKTLAEKAERKAHPRPIPYHYSAEGFGNRAECMRARMKGRIWYSSRRSRASVTSDVGRVTCKACLNLIEKGGLSK